MIVCQTLGPVGLTVDGGPAPPALLWRKHLALLVYLARSPRGRSREHLVGLLWPEKPETAARHSLTEAIGVLRRHLGDTAVDASAAKVRVAPDAISLDLDQFETLAASGEWEAAARMIAGDFLEGFSVPAAPAFDSWLETQRSSVRNRSVEVLTSYADQLIRVGRAPEAVSVALQALALDPHSERALRSSMRSQALAGDRAGAIEEYERFCSRLTRELGTAPGNDTRTLAERIRQERSAPAVLPNAKPEDALLRLPLVGRESQLSRLLEAADAARLSGHAAVLIIEGDSGTGKTRLSEELLARLRLDGVVVASARAVEADQREEWSGLLALARSDLVDAPGVAAAQASALRTFADTLHEWRERFPALPREGSPASPGRALSEILRAATDEQPVALAVDDAQWLDQVSLLSLLAVLRDLASAPLLIVLAADSHPARAELDEVRTRLGRDLHGAAVRLAALDSSALRSLAQSLLPTFNSVEIERLVRRVAIDSAGLPLLAVELLQAVASGLDLRATPAAWPEPLKTLDQTLPGDLPDTVVAAIRIRFRRLTPTAQRVLSHAAVIGDRVPPELLSRVVGLPPEELAPALDELEWHHWLLCEPRGYTFLARVVRQVIARDTLTAGQRLRVIEAAGQRPPAP
jgi:DNA-binding SARP family transcriptional activator